MILARLLCIPCALVLTIGAAGSMRAQSQPAQKPFEPYYGLPGKDIGWVPTPQSVVNKMLDLAKVTPEDYVMDLGSGDGRIVITAAKRGARATGIEYTPELVDLSIRNADSAGVSAKTNFVRGDLFETDLSKATVITMFLLPEINLKLRPKLLTLTPGTRVVSNSFTMGDWEPDDTISVDENSGCTYYWCKALLWFVPANVEGTWHSPTGDFAITQTFQMISGTLTSQGKNISIEHGIVRGDRVTFMANGATYEGQVRGNSIEGTVAGPVTERWSASLAPGAGTAPSVQVKN
jgi:SAM-dependent methyltransferase